ncbi:possible cytosine-specific DNA methylase [Aurantimonas manganoxydans SI85-9A1]|uniref:Cytosine-specific methyltransferase n=1 Tax=Aurantimonas manganoxydans (strain ATCC BAA-1229 / DSM 21871 / SI85-9A1) TaxID=287752 RepID=Q1YE76_AURMS|nr:DNA (cytosine-5-)-methyltransferase [Aurantimonas manganoxydans]EAS48523.1 possible cytosine-specific DNA methylase [Aurantimonas manganoxydans SI85-9A1]
MRAIDLYAGIGGWSLGLRLAGVEVVASYEWWQAAVDTHNGNHGGDLKPVDVRQLHLHDLPPNIDLVVGSPPCTEFSYSNRGGGGDLDEGLKDLVRFMEVIDHLRPKFWALENVPRVAQVLERGMADARHPLYRFRHLEMQIKIINFSDYGTPQSRRRCIAGNIPFDAIASYQSRLPRRTLGDVVAAIASSDEVVDPVWGCVLPAATLTERQTEGALNAEELRMNREAKTYHPVYNNMAFPDAMDLPGRTVTATCTRVSRESIVIQDGANRFRRLSIRERACLQGFPITYQFYAKSFPEKVRMVGNAIPPTFAYLVAQAAKGISPGALVPYSEAGVDLRLPRKAAIVTPPTTEGRTYPAGRSFRAALPGLRFKSGMRFELANGRGQERDWQVRFFFGPSVDIRQIELDQNLLRQLRTSPLIKTLMMAAGVEFAMAEQRLQGTTPAGLQAAWSHRAEGMRPFEVADLLGELGIKVHRRLQFLAVDDQHAVIGYVMAAAAEEEEGDYIPGSKKLTTHALAILSGLLVGAWFNTLPWHRQQKAAA